MNRIIREYFTFSKKERVAVIILLSLIGGFIALPYLFLSTKTVNPVADKELITQLAKLQQNRPKEITNNKEGELLQTYQSSIDTPPLKFELFPFDPNTIDPTVWKRLGLSDKTIHTILNYRNKGGKFRSAEDIRKIWGLRKEEADRIIPYAKVAITQNQSTYYHSINKQVAYKTATIPTSPFDINTASPQDLMQIPGMDHSIPYKIIRFRDKLGGFWDVQQVKQTYGMTDSLYKVILPFLKIEKTTLRKININSCSVNELNREPFISHTIAQAIIIYRNQHGSYQNIEDIKKIAFLTEEMFQKIMPYLTVQ